MTTAESGFPLALESVRQARLRPEFRLDETPAPQRLSPFALAPGALTQRIADSAAAAGATPVLGTLHGTDAAVDVVLARVRSARETYLTSSVTSR